MSDYPTKSSSQPSDEKVSTNSRPDSFRTYRIPAYICDEEREMLALLNAESWQGMFCRVYDQFYPLIFLMRRFDDGEDLDGYTLNLIAESLDRPLDALGRLCSMVSDFELVEAE